ncbi:MAG: UDP-4-amino-4,6-dideoxy-N-acetyl-beta-L-altrosamine transaminase [Gammaproteobacteria bacterium]|nr:UDP-4-amino-4,6-dideoxy-N-acetyl-beta-L-altrosamine transaminase [Gammaproteobacteria bacterium]
MIPYGRHYIDEDDIQAVAEVLRHGALTQGPKVGEFERAVADYVGARYAVAVSSGTSALHLAAMVADLGPGDTLITTPNTFVASANCGAFVGATVQFADIDPQTLNMSPTALALRCQGQSRVRAIVPVHFAGLPCDMPAIRAVAKQHRAVVIEDASHALGASYPDGGRVGNGAHSDMTVFSFHPVKHIAAGEGGMIVTNNENYYRRLIRLRSHGINKGDDPTLCKDLGFTDGAPNPWYYEMQELGYNYRITDIQSALALSQMRKLDRFVARRRELVRVYDETFRSWRGVRPGQTHGRDLSSHHLYVLRIDFAALKTSRAKLMWQLAEHGIGSQVHYIPVHFHPYYRRAGQPTDDLAATEQYYREALSIPLYFGLTAEQQRSIIDRLAALTQ